MVHFAHLVEMVPSLAPLADLPRGWWAGTCDDPDHDEWHRRPITLRARARAWLRRT